MALAKTFVVHEDGVRLVTCEQGLETTLYNVNSRSMKFLAPADAVSRTIWSTICPDLTRIPLNTDARYIREGLTFPLYLLWPDVLPHGYFIVWISYDDYC